MVGCNRPSELRQPYSSYAHAHDHGAGFVVNEDLAVGGEPGLRSDLNLTLNPRGQRSSKTEKVQEGSSFVALETSSIYLFFGDQPGSLRDPLSDKPS